MYRKKDFLLPLSLCVCVCLSVSPNDSAIVHERNTAYNSVCRANLFLLANHWSS